MDESRNQDNALPSTREELFKKAASRGNANPVELTIRELVRYWGAERRGEHIVERIRRDLSAAKLATYPAFTDGWIDTRVALLPIFSNVKSHSDVAATASKETVAPQVSLRVRSLESANRGVVYVLLDDTLVRAQSLMMSRDYSQLAVMNGPRNLRGAISWESIAHAKIGNPEAELRDAIFQPETVRPDDDLLAQIPRIANAGFVFVEARDRQISGIVTPADLSLLFFNLARPFFVLAEIEGHLRRLADKVFDSEDFAQVIDPSDSERSITQASDLTLGQFVRLLEDPKRWCRFAWDIDRSIFIADLKNVQEIRNEVLHFSPDPLDDTQVNALELFLKLLRKLDPEP